jgi:GNAT superfamily N-acetyltransferase
MRIEFLKDNPGFVDKIADLMFNEWGHIRQGTTIERYNNYLREKLNSDIIPLTLIAKSENDELLGFASIVTSDMETNNELSPWISGVFVVPEYRGKGFGGLLVDKLEQIASDLGFEKLYLYTFDREKFYSNLSWVKIKDEFYLNSKVVVMTKDLKRIKDKNLVALSSRLPRQ